MKRTDDRNLFLIAVALIALAIGIMLLAPRIVRAQTPEELQRRIERLERELGELQQSIRQNEREASGIRLHGFERLAAVEREVELNRAGGIIGLAGNAAALLALFNRLGKINKAVNGDNRR